MSTPLGAANLGIARYGIARLGIVPTSGDAIIPWTPDYTFKDLWLDAADSSTIVSSLGKVAAWRDKSGFEFDVLQGNAGLQPTTGLNTLNSKNIVNFDGTSDRLSSSANADFLSNTQFTVFAVTLAEQFESFNKFLSCRTGSSPVDRRFDIGRNSATNKWGMGTQTLGDGELVYAAVAPGFVPLISATEYTNPGLQLWMNGDDKGSVATPSSPLVCDELLNVGGPDLDGFTYAGNIAEIVIIAGPVTADIRQRMEGYLAWKWGLVANLPIGHPYKDSPPTIDPASTGFTTGFDAGFGF